MSRILVQVLNYQVVLLMNIACPSAAQLGRFFAITKLTFTSIESPISVGPNSYQQTQIGSLCCAMATQTTNNYVCNYCANQSSSSRFPPSLKPIAHAVDVQWCSTSHVQPLTLWKLQLDLDLNKGMANSTQTWAGALVQWLWEESHVPKVMSSNPGTVYWIDIFSRTYLL